MDYAAASSNLSWLVRLFALLLVALTTAKAETNTVASPRLSVVVLPLNNSDGDPTNSHWRYSIQGMLGSELGIVKSLRVFGQEAGRMAVRQLNLDPTKPLDEFSARKIGELVEARRVVWGGFQREGRRWKITARVLNAAT